MRSTAWATIYLGWGEDPNNEFGIALNDWIEIDKASKELGHPLIFGSTEYESYYRNKVITIVKEHPDFLLKTIMRRILITLVYPSDLGISYPKETDGTPLSPAKTPSEEYKKSYPTISESIKMILDGSIVTYAKRYLHLIFYILVVFISALAPLALSILAVYLRRDRWREFMLIGSLPIYFSLVSLLILSVSTKAKLPECVSYMVMSSVAIYYIYDLIRYKRFARK
jgi:hypothetical protein